MVVLYLILIIGIGVLAGRTYAEFESRYNTKEALENKTGVVFPNIKTRVGFHWESNQAPENMGVNMDLFLIKTPQTFYNQLEDVCKIHSRWSKTDRGYSFVSDDEDCFCMIIFYPDSINTRDSVFSGTFQYFDTNKWQLIEKKIHSPLYLGNQ